MARCCQHRSGALGAAVYMEGVMASAAERSGKAGQLKRSTHGDGGQDRSRLLPVLAAERLFRAVLLVVSV